MDNIFCDAINLREEPFMSERVAVIDLGSNSARLIILHIYANRAYAVLNHELRLVQADEGGQHARALFSLGDPVLDWVKLAEGMGVHAVRSDTTKGFAEALKAALREPGPRLIEAVV